MMMQPQHLQSSWSIINSSIHQSELFGLNMETDIHHDQEMSPSLTTTEDSSGMSTYSFYPPIMSNEFVEFPILGDENIANYMEGFDAIPGSAIEDICRWLNEKEGSENPSHDLSIQGQDLWSPGLSTYSSEASVVLQSSNLSLTLPGENMEIDNQSVLLHLLKAYGEAIELDQRELAEVIVASINEKVSPIGEPLERVAFSLFESMANPNHGDYLKQESMKNFDEAFKAFYDIFPYGRFAHFAANSAILESIPAGVVTIHIVDLDIGEGLQWAPVIKAIARQQKALRITCIKSEEVDCGHAPSRWRFEDTKRRLYDHARSLGLKLKVDEVRIGDLASEIETSNGREWLAFNCMVGLPHMEKTKCRSRITEFLGLAKELIHNSKTNRGLVIFGDGEDGERMKNRSGSSYSSYFEAYLAHYRALCESMEVNFPNYLIEARMAMEAIFVAPYVSALSWFDKYEEEIREEKCVVGVQGRRISKESLMESREMVKGGDNSYSVRVEGEREDELVLEWRGTPLVRVCSWM